MKKRAKSIRNNIYLVGFMGTGKSCVGRELARQKKMRFLDLDQLIERGEGKPISEIFAQRGEPYFRLLEKLVLRDVTKKKNHVVACGGGIVINEENIKTMKKSGTIICLSATPAAILQRTSAYKHRPLLNVSDPKKKIAQLLKLRAPFYALANRTIDTSRLCIDAVVKKVLRLTEAKRKRRTVKKKKGQVSKGYDAP
ncbi:shikimate kinase [Candidatus Omnitrophota bacterium]